jgi:hypothetical protein
MVEDFRPLEIGPFLIALWIENCFEGEISLEDLIDESSMHFSRLGQRTTLGRKRLSRSKNPEKNSGRKN